MDETRIAAILSQAKGFRGNNNNENEGNDKVQTEIPEEVPIVEKVSSGTASKSATLDTRTDSNRSTSAPPSSKFSKPQLHRPNALTRILVNPSQIHGNPLMEEIKKIPRINYEVSKEIMADYVTGYTSCVLLLSLKYHGLHPDYIETRINKLGNSHDLKVLLVIIDVDNSSESLKELTRMTVNKDITIIAAGTFREAADYVVGLFKQQQRPPTLLQKAPKESYKDQITDVSTKVRNVSSANMFTLAAKYGSLKLAIEKSTSEDIDQLPGWGEKKAEAFHRAFNDSFY